MLNDYDELMSAEIGEILISPRLTLNLLKIASLILLNGTPPRGCSKSIKGYYDKLKLPLTREKIIIIMEKTCKLKPGLLYIAKEAKHFSDANMDDETATRLLEAGTLKPDHFLKLPEVKKVATKKKHKDIID